MARGYFCGGSGGTTSDDCTALKSHVLEGKTAVTRDSDDEPAEGTMPKKINGQIANGCTFYQDYLYYQIPYGYYPNAYTNTECEVRIEQDKVAAAIGVTAEKLMQGQSILGVNGTATSDDTATPDDLLYGKTAHSKGKKITGKIQSQGPMTLNPGTTAKTASVSGKYMTGNITVPAISIPASAIKKGHKITFPDGSSVTGTFEGWVPVATDLYYNGQNPAGFTSDSITFENTRLNFKYSFGELNFTKTHDVRSFSKLNLIGDIGWTKDALQICLRDANDKNIVAYEKFDGWTSCALDISQLTSIPSGWNLYFRNVYTGTERNHYITRIWLS